MSPVSMPLALVRVRFHHLRCRTGDICLYTCFAPMPRTNRERWADTHLKLGLVTRPEEHLP